MNSTRSYPRTHFSQARVGAIGYAGGVLLTDTVRTVGIDTALSGALARWRKPFAVYDPAKIVLDLAITLALGGDTLSDIDVVRSEPGVYGRVASDATVSRLIRSLSRHPEQALQAISDARQVARAHAWAAAGVHAPDAAITGDEPLIIDLDATLVTSHSEKEQAMPTYKRGYGFHPLLAFIDHGAGATGEPVAGILRPGNAGANTATDHIAVTREAFRQLPADLPRNRVMIRTDGAGGTKDFLAYLTGEGVSYSVGYGLPFITSDLYQLIPEEAWEPALDAASVPRPGADVTEITDILPGSGWPASMRVILRRELPHPGAQLRFEDVDGYRLTAFATNLQGGRLPDLELQHRQRARCEDRIRNLKDAGLTNFPLHGFHQNEIWLQLVLLATELTAWMGLLALTNEQARVWEPKKLRHRLYTIPAILARGGRRMMLRFSHRHPEAGLLIDAMTRLRMLPAPAS